MLIDQLCGIVDHTCFQAQVHFVDHFLICMAHQPAWQSHQARPLHIRGGTDGRIRRLPSRFDGRCTAYHFARGCRCAWLDAPAHVCAKIPPNGDDTKGRSPVASLSRWCTFPAVIPGMAPAHLWAVAAGEPAGWCLGHGNLRLIVDQFHGFCDVNDI